MEEVRIALVGRREMAGGRLSSVLLLLLVLLVTRGLLRFPPRAVWPRLGRGAGGRAIVVGVDCGFVEGAACVATGGI